MTTFEDLMKFSSSFWAICIRKYRDEETYSDKKENIRSWKSEVDAILSVLLTKETNNLTF